MIHKHTISFINAWNGLKWALKTQPNYKIHFLFSLMSIFGGLFFKISYYEFIIIIALITGGISIETVNTAIEQTTDAIDLTKREDIRLAKDVAAGAMLAYAIGAFIIACIIFIPRIISLIS